MHSIDDLRKRKRELRLTFEELSVRSGVSVPTLKNIFTGKTCNPRIDTLDAIEHALGLNEEPSQKLKNIPVAFYESLEGLSDESIQDILDYVEFVKEREKKR